MHAKCPLHMKKPYIDTLYKISWIIQTFPSFVYPALAPSALPLLLSGSAPGILPNSYALLCRYNKTLKSSLKYKNI